MRDKIIENIVPYKKHILFLCAIGIIWLYHVDAYAGWHYDVATPVGHRLTFGWYNQEVPDDCPFSTKMYATITAPNGHIYKSKIFKVNKKHKYTNKFELNLPESAATGYYIQRLYFNSKVEICEKTLVYDPIEYYKVASLTIKSPKKGFMEIKWKDSDDYIKIIDGVYDTVAISGVQFWVSRNKRFKGHYKKNFYGAFRSKVISGGWPSKKFLYVKMRCFKKIGKKTRYSKWSKVKKIKIK